MTEPKRAVIELAPGCIAEDVYFLLPRERDTVLAALRLWQDVNTESGRRFYGNLFSELGLTEIATNGGEHEGLDATEIDILIEDKLNAITRAAEPAEIVITVEGGIIQSIDNIPPGVRVRVMDFDVNDFSHPSMRVSEESGHPYYEAIYE